MTKEMKKTVLTIALSVLAAVLTTSYLTYYFVNEASIQVEQKDTPSQFVSLPASSLSSTVDFTFAAEKSIHAVVHVWTERIEEGYTSPYQLFFGYGPSQRRSLSSGSGVIVSDDGFIMTNNHVVDKASKIKVKLNSGKIYDASLIGQDKSTDLALLKIEGESLPYLAFGNSDEIKVGQWVLAVGNPFNLSSTVTAGIVSAKARNINLLEYDPSSNKFPIESFIQTDAAVNPGNSGGALVGVNGELLGINTAIASSTGSYAGYSFAVPSTLVQKVFKDLFEFGSVQRAYIGVQIRDLNESLMDEVDLNNFDGVYVSGVYERGAAEKAGLKEGDVILAVEGRKVKNVTQLQENIGRYRPGDSVELELWRDDKTKKVTVTLQNMDGTTDLKINPKVEEIKMYGGQFRTANTNELGKLGLKNGVKVLDIGKGMLSTSGIQKGFIITKVDKIPIKSTDELEQVMKNRIQNGILLEGVYPDGNKAFYGLGM